jgi:hypothetical protein
MEHCKEHEKQTVCTARLKERLESIKSDGHSKLNDLANEVNEVWRELKTKLSNKAFAWVVGGLVSIMVITLGFHYNKLDGISTQVQTIKITQAVIADRLGVTDEVTKRMKK